MALPKEKAPGPDGFTGIFYQVCWNTIKEDIMAALQQLYQRNSQNLEYLNSAHVILLPKKEISSTVTDYRPISLMHSFAKLFSKLLANRLAARMDDLVGVNQSAFIKKRCIHENFMYVQGVVKELHRKKEKALFVKLDISKAFDTVGWPYLIQLLQKFGFGPRWRAWVSMLFCTASSSFLVNGSAGSPIQHRRGVRQGDPLSPLLFILAMEPLSKMLQLAQQRQILEHMPESKVKFRTSIYADDAAVFIRPTPSDITVLTATLDVFARATGLRTNMEKTEFFPLNCNESDILALQSSHELQISSFPCIYLGLPLSHRRLGRSAAQQVVNKVANRLPGWKRDLLNYTGRETLVKSVLSAVPTYFLTALNLPKWAMDKIDRYRRGFLWKGHDIREARGGRCLVNWKLVCRPKKYGGLGIKDLDRFGRSLRMRWYWNMWSTLEKPWKSVIKLTDKADRSLFFASTLFTVGNGKRTPFWEGNWLMGKAPRNLAPNLYKMARFKHRTVDKELCNYAWIRNLKGLPSQDHIDELNILLQALLNVQLNNEDDKIHWKWTAHGEYTAKSAYEAQFVGAVTMKWPMIIWKAHAEPKCKFFAWLILHNKANTAEILAIKNWPHNDYCMLCTCMFETTDHLFRDCVFTEALWDRICTVLHLPQLAGTRAQSKDLQQWVHSLVTGASKQDKRRFMGILLYLWWEIWKERNRRIFNQVEESYLKVSDRVLSDIRCFKLAIEVP
ncbi:hypothetical protein ACP70R_019572 [Stipagrostis hirtigluma subsp. patula]